MGGCNLIVIEHGRHDIWVFLFPKTAHVGRWNPQKPAKLDGNDTTTHLHHPFILCDFANCALCLLVVCIGACRPRHTRALHGLFGIMGAHITMTGCEDTRSPAYSMRVHRRTYSVQCFDKIRFPQLCIKCGVAKSCPSIPTKLCRCPWLCA